MQSKFVIVGTAGHIDHGKTTLIKALTGVDTDRWEEEKRRGMTIDLGFAKLTLPSGTLAGIVDVPGHEKFIKNMLAGASGVDLVLFVIAADEGIMPQTKEHLTVCQMLGTKRGIVVLTKKDLVDQEWLELVKEEVKEFLKGTFLEEAPIVEVSAKTGEGIDKLIEEIDKIAQKVEGKPTDGIVRLPVDRSFTVKGFGTVITGTLISGKVSLGDSLEILPKGYRVKVRNVQVHGEKREFAVAGQRTALNLSDISKEEVERGDLLATPDFLKPTKILDVRLHLSRDAEVIVTSSFKIHFHHLTKEAEGEIFLIDKEELLPGETAFAQIRLKEEVVPVYGDRFVIRNYSPARVIGGGEVIFPLPQRKFRKKFKKEKESFLKVLEEENLEKKALALVKEFFSLTPTSFVQLLNLTPEKAKVLAESLVEKEKLILSNGKLYLAELKEKLKEKVVKILEEYHEKYPISEGINKESFKTLTSAPGELLLKAVEELKEEGKIEEEEGILKLKGFIPSERGTRYESMVKEVERIVEEGKFSPPNLKEIAKLTNFSEETVNLIASYLQSRKGYVKVGEILLSPKALREIVEILKNHFKKKGTLSIGEFKDYLGVSRKFAIPILEFLDRKGITVRKGNERIPGSLQWKRS